MRIGIFSKLGSSGGSEHRCAEMCNSILRHSMHEAVLLCEEKLNDQIRRKLDLRTQVIEQVFKPKPTHLEALYQVDRLLIINSDSYSFTKLDFWEGKTEHHKGCVDVARIRQMSFLFNFVVSPAKNLWTIAGKCPDVRVICTSQSYFDEISDKDKFQRVWELPRVVLRSPIDPESVRTTKVPSELVRIGKHSKAFGYKFNEEHPKLIERINRKYGPRIHWDFLGVPRERSRELKKIPNVTVRPEYSVAVDQYLQEIDIFLFFISWGRDEPWSRAVAEAMMSGCPVLATNRAGNREQVVHGNTGYLCNTLDEFEHWLCHLIEQPAKVAQLGRNARLNAQQFTSQKIVRDFLDFIEA